MAMRFVTSSGDSRSTTETEKRNGSTLGLPGVLKVDGLGRQRIGLVIYSPSGSSRLLIIRDIKSNDPSRKINPMFKKF